jgi:tRNA modification GTPase
MDTIFALSSGKGKAGVSVVRVSGTKAKDCLKHFKISDIQPRKACLKSLKNEDGNIIDKALIILFEAPSSFTGEDTVEIHAHGSIAVVSEILEVLGNISGYRYANPGEFSRIAFENGKMDLLQAEGLADLIEAETKAQQKQAMRQMEGEFSGIYEDWRERIIEIMAFVEAYVDFPDEDIPNDLDEQAISKIKEIVSEMENQLNNKAAERVRNGIVVTILGKPNAGKSTLINFLTKRDLAIVSDIAGTTRDSLEANFEISGVPVTLIDTAGIRETEDKIEKEGVRRALEKAENSDYKIYIVDGETNEVSTNLIDENTLVIINKCDIAKSSNIEKDFLRVSLKENINTDEIIIKLSNIVESLAGNSEQTIVTRERHRKLLKDCLHNLENYTNSRIDNLPIELCAENLRLASHAIGKIIGKIDVEDVLDKIFSDFCIGK